MGQKKPVYDPIKGAKRIIIGTVLEVKDTPDDDFYFHQAKVNIDTTLKGDTTEKIVTVKYIYPAVMTKERYIRGRNWENVIKRTMPPEEFLKKKWEEPIVVADFLGSPQFHKDEKVLLFLRDYPYSVHQWYNGPYDKANNRYISFLGDFFPYNDEKFNDITKCEGYYEIIRKYSISDNRIREETAGLIVRGKGEKAVDDLDKFLLDLENKLTRQAEEK